MSENIFLFLISASGLFVAFLVMMFFVKTKLNVFHPLVIIFFVAVIDVFLPGLLWSLNGMPAQPEWVTPLRTHDVIAGVLVYLMSYIAMFIGYTFVGSPQRLKVRASNLCLSRERFSIALWLCFILAVLQLILAMASYGSIAGWFGQKIMVRWGGGLGDEAPSFFEVFPIRILFSMFVIVGFYFRYKLQKPRMLGYFFPIVALLLAASTFFRGAILVFLLGLLFVERLRVREQTRSVGHAMQSIDMTLIKWGVCAVFLFLAYGTLRDNLSQESWGEETKVDSSPLSRGDGLVGVASIVKYFESPSQVMLGKTYIDMLLLPVPRFIYTSKPQWYGIDDITRSMGWAESTQSAVTMPGEAYANFWIFGIVFMIVLGAGFGWVNRFACSDNPIGLFLYPSAFLYLVINANWMAFTGIANQFLPIFLCAIGLYFVFTKRVTCE